jgi:hypothetical protein
MTKLISILVILVVGFIGYHLFEYWQSVNKEEDIKKPANQMVSEDQLPGMPYQLQQSYQKAKEKTATLREWLKTYGATVQDPRKAAIQLDFCMMVAREDVSEAKRVFAEVKQRTSKTSPIWPRIEQMQKTYE